MATATEKPKLLYREASIDTASLKADSRELDLSFASEQAVERYDYGTGKTYMEILDHSSKTSADFSRLNDSGALLREHDRDDQIGVIIPGSCVMGDDKKSRCRVRFSRSPLGEQELQDVRDGIRTKISFGYETGREISREIKEGVEFRRYEWMPYEVSTVSIPADTTVGIGRAAAGGAPVDSPPPIDVDKIASQLNAEQKSRMKILLDPAAKDATGAAALDETKIRTNERETERARIAEITKVGELLAKDHGTKDEGKMGETIRTMINDAIAKGESSDAFKVRCMEEVLKAKPAKQVRMADLGFDEQEIRSYSLVRALQNCLKRGQKLPDPDTLEGEAHVRMTKLNLGFENEGFLVPADANISPRSLSRSDRRRMQRDLIATNFNQGGATVQTDVILPIIEILRNKMVTEALGVRTMAGLQGNVVIPRQTAAATAYSVPETGALTLSTQVLDQIALTPKRVGAFNNYSKQLLLQSSIDVENFVRDDLLRVIALDWDRIIINGQGANSEALGVINTPGVQAVAFGAAATFAKLVAFETAIAVLNAPPENRAYISTSAVKGVLKSAAKLLTGATTVAAVALWENDMINGYPAVDSQQVPNNLVVFGSWSEVILGLWGGYDVVINPYSGDTQALVRITMNTWGDVAVRHPQSFCVSADAGNQ